MSTARRVLVTGGAGFIGANIVRRLLLDGHEVNLLIGPATNAWRLDGLTDDVRVLEASLEDADAVAAVVRMCRPEWVLHLAAHGAYASQRSVERIVSTNVVGTVNLVEACLRADIDAFVHTGTSSEYGFKDHAPTEREWLDPNSCYAVTKAAATMYCRFSSIASGVPLTTLRIYSAYGPWEEPSRLLPSLVALGLGGSLPPLVSPHTARDFVHVDDAVEACVLAASGTMPPGAVYNIGTGTQTSLAELVEIVRRRLGVTEEPAWGSMEGRDWDTDVWVAEPAAARAELGWAPRWTLEQGIEQLTAWFGEDDQRLAFYREHRTAPA